MKGDVRAMIPKNTYESAQREKEQKGDKSVLYEMTANSNDADEWCRLGIQNFEKGNTKEAVLWLKKAAEINHPDACHRLAGLYEYGASLGVFPDNDDEREVISLYKNAANFNAADAMFELGKIYCTGICGKWSVKQDIEEGCRYIDRGIRLYGDKEAIELIGDDESTDKKKITFVGDVYVNFVCYYQLSELFWFGVNNKDRADSLAHRTIKDLGRTLFFHKKHFEDKDLLKKFASRAMPGEEDRFIALLEHGLKSIYEIRYDIDGQYVTAIKILNDIDSLSDLSEKISKLNELLDTFSKEKTTEDYSIADYKEAPKYAEICRIKLEEFTKEGEKFVKKEKSMA